MSTETDQGKRLRERVEEIAEGAGTRRIGVAYHDYASGTTWAHNGDQWFHAASTMKVPVLVGVFAAVGAGEIGLEARVHVRNRFFSVTDGTPYRIESSRDGNSAVHGQVGKTMKVLDLARHMIVTSSNLATNLLVDLVGVERLQRTLEELGVGGIEIRRGVEDEQGFAQGINNRVTASGLVDVLRLIEEEKAISREASDRMLEILHAQEFRSGIPAGLPGDARVANKTGEISTVAHDTGLVYLADREPYALAILTEWEPEVSSGRKDTVAAVSRAVYQHLTREDDVDR
jgi:beta-lactamase class A